VVLTLWQPVWTPSSDGAMVLDLYRHLTQIPLFLED